MTTSSMSAAASGGSTVRLKLGYDRAAVDELIAAGELEVADRFASAIERDEGLDLVRDVVEMVKCHAVWTWGGDRGKADVFADFTSDGEGFLMNDGHLTLSVYLHKGALIADPGISRLTDLPHTSFGTVHDVLDGVLELLNERVHRVRSAFGCAGYELPASPQMESNRDSEASVETGDLLPIVARQVTASEETVAEALRASWSAMEDRLDAIREEMIADARRRLLVGAEAPECADDGEFVVHPIGISVYSGRLKVQWKDGATSTVGQNDPATGDLYEALCDALDAIETENPIHHGGQTDATSCVCGDPAIVEGA